MQTAFAITLALAFAGRSSATPQNYVSTPQWQTGCESVEYRDVPENERAPHQLYRFEQVTGPLQCNTNVGCEIANVDTNGKSIGVTAGIDPTGGFIPNGLSVSEYVEQGETQNCQGVTGEEICVFYRTAHTIYTAESQTVKNCRGENDWSRTTITAPNADGLGSGPLCARNEQCKNKGYTYWNNMESHNGGSTWAEGPVDWPFGEKVTGILPEIEPAPKEE